MMKGAASRSIAWTPVAALTGAAVICPASELSHLPNFATLACACCSAQALSQAADLHSHWQDAEVHNLVLTILLL